MRGSTAPSFAAQTRAEPISPAAPSLTCDSTAPCSISSRPCCWRMRWARTSRSTDRPERLTEWRPVRALGLDRDPAVAGAHEQQSLAGLLHPLDHGLAGAFERAVVVDDEDATRHQPGVEVRQLVLRRGVPVGVEAEQGDALGGVLGDRLLDEPLHQVEPIARVGEL